jgi:hypothetical protein
MKSIYGVIKWINGRPLLEGMPAFLTPEAAVTLGIEIEQTGFYDRVTIIRINIQGEN